jgi:hypothetical protein
MSSLIGFAKKMTVSVAFMHWLFSCQALADSPDSYALRFPSNQPVARLRLFIPHRNLDGSLDIDQRDAMAMGRIVIPRVCAVYLELRPNGLKHINTLDQFDPNQFRRIDCSNLDLTDQELEHLRRFTLLEYLRVNGTLITDRSLPTIGGFRQLSELRLSNTALTGKTLFLVTSLPKLRTLALDGTNLSKNSIRRIAELKKSLEVLSLAKLRLEDSDLTAICSLTRLKDLDISGNQHLSDGCISAICQLPSLRSLNIADTGITAKSLQRLSHMHALEEVVVRKSVFCRGFNRGRLQTKRLVLTDIADTSNLPPEIFDPLH